MQDLALDLAIVADGAGVEAARHPGVGDDPPVLHSCFEFGMAGDPVVDGARRYADELGQLVVDGAEQAVVMCQLAKVGGVAGGTAYGAHGVTVATLRYISNNFSKDFNAKRRRGLFAPRRGAAKVGRAARGTIACIAGTGGVRKARAAHYKHTH